MERSAPVLAKNMATMLEVTAKPTTTNIVYPQANSTTNVGCDQQSSEFKTFVAEQDTTSIKVDNTEHKSISNNKNI